MGMIFSLFAVVALIAIVLAGVKVAAWYSVFGILVPYAALGVFLAGFIRRVLKWACTPVPFRIPTTAGQQLSFPWIRRSPLDNPSSAAGAAGRVLLEVLFFRSLFRNTGFEVRDGAKIAFHREKWLWPAALLFHYSLLVILIRHLRFFTEPVPGFVQLAGRIDGALQVGLPGLYVTDLLFPAALVILFIRRVAIPRVRYISLAADYFPLFLLLALAVSGVFMRYFTRIDVIGAKELAMGLASFHPSVPGGIGVLFHIHLFLACTLFACFPFSKLMHMGGIFLSPTRNLPNDSRMKRHVNPWNHPVRVHTYREYEDRFSGRMAEAGLPMEKD